MSTTKSEFLNELKSRGYVHQVTDEEALDKLAKTDRITGYIGFDCTAPSLHVGNLLGIMMLRKLQQAGHRPIVLIGGGTTKVGDPSGKDEARKLLNDAEIAANVAGIQSAFGKFISFGEGETDALLINNADWLDELR
ncbi:MAG: tyrosine--tRNA ligase, partial [Methyloceanibacter sp.]